MLQSRHLDLLKALRPNAVALVDAFDFPDAVLDSALGRWDGQVYEALYDFSLRSKLNEKEVCFDSLGGEGGRERICDGIFDS